MARYLAVDIGASSGRHMLGWVENGRMQLSEVYRFDNGMVEQNGRLCWDVEALEGHVLAGMRAAGQDGQAPVSVAVDTWGVDYVLMDADGGRLGDVRAYRDRRNEDMDAVVEKILPFEELYAITGIQKLSFNTIYQLMARKLDEPELLEKANRLLLLPDYLHYRLCDVMANEYTDASTTALLDAEKRTWSYGLIERLGLPEKLFCPLSQPGSCIGRLSGAVQKEVGYTCKVVLPASHDTGSAYAAVPVRDANAATLSSGTWSLLGVESLEPVITEEARKANFTNEGGYGGTIRFLKNIMGLWMIQSVRRETGKRYSYAEMEQMARESAGYPGFVDVLEQGFMAPQIMIEAVAAACVRGGYPAPVSIGQTVRCIYQSLARCYRDAIRDMERVIGKKFTSLNVVGGGSKDTYLNQLTANAIGLPVHAGPTEGTVIGNLAVQMLAAGEFSSLAQARAAVAESFAVKTFLPGEAE